MEWRQYNQYYDVSDAGELRSTQFNKIKILKGLVKPDGYKMFYLKHDSAPSKWKYIHRLVAILFVPNPDNLPEVNHKDRNKANNAASNLEWCKHAYNIQHSYDNGRKRYSGVDSWNTGRKASEETRRIMSEKKKLYWQRKQPDNFS